MRALRALFADRAWTDPASRDPALTGRTYGVPFDRVWRESLALASVAMAGWVVLDSDDGRGTIRAEVKGRLLALPSDVVIRIGLDRDAQTRVDLESVSRTARIDLGSNRRRIRRFCRALDEAIGRSPARAGTR